MRALIEQLTRASIGAVFLAALVGGAAILHIRAVESKSAATTTSAPIPVESLIVKKAGGYDIVDRFVGRLEPAQQASISFERGGLVTSIIVEEGQSVVQGQIIAKLDTALLKAERDRLVGQRSQIASKHELSRLTLKRKRTLRRKKHVSQQVLDEARLNTASLKGELIAIRALDINIEKSILHAPFTGTVGVRSIDTGVVVTAGTTVIDLLESARPQARLGVSPEAASRLRTGEHVRLFVGQKKLSGKIVALRPDLSSATRTISVLISLKKTHGTRFGDTVELSLSRRIKAPGFWIPIEALNEGERGLWSVLTLSSSDGKLQRVGFEAVELLHSHGNRVFVRGTLQAGQRIVASGRNRIIRGQVVMLARAREVRS